MSKFWRDSSGCIINTAGDVLFSRKLDGDTLSSRSLNSLVWEKTVLKIPYEIDFLLPNGKVDSQLVSPYSIPYYEYSAILTMKDGSNISHCKKDWIKIDYFGDGFGELKSQLAYLNEFQSSCTYYERRLSYYYIAQN
jgi:hypothetical protein